jgi:release factor glutamine methyltransferase
LAIAAVNATLHAEGRKSPVRFIESDWYDALTMQAAQQQSFDIIASNPPYIVAGDAHLAQGDLRFEPVDALTDHGDGLSAFRTIVLGAPAHLNPEGGWLLMEHGYDQASALRKCKAGGIWPASNGSAAGNGSNTISDRSY